MVIFNSYVKLPEGRNPSVLGGELQAEIAEL
jgi:hypothetical protein